MPGTIHISMRALGRRKQLLDDWSVPAEPFDTDDGEPLTLRMVITRVVRHTVEEFQRRQEANRFVSVLSAASIAEQSERGKVNSGGSELDQEVDVDEAVASALIAFEDGLYLVVIDGHEHRELDAQVFLKPDSRLTFIRLVMLAGG